MKISLLLILGSAISLHAGSVFSQNNKMTVDMQDVTVREVIKEIEKQGGISFLFNDNLQQLNRHVSVSHVDHPVLAVLFSALEQADMMYEEVGENFLVLLSKPGYLKQQNTITGRVTDASTGEPLPGTNVFIQGTTTGTITDLNGGYSLQIPEKEDEVYLVFSFIGYVSQTVNVEDRSVIDVQLMPDISGLEEVVVIGYGFQQKRDLTGAVSVVELENISAPASGNVMQSLQGQLPGINVSADGTPGSAGLTVRIRGYGTLGNNDPLYIIDGLQTNNTADILALSINEIESIQVLKDAASASIYGSRAANGVIIITTKRAPVGYRISFESQVGVQTLGRRLDMLDSQQYGQMLWQALRNDGRELTHAQYGTGNEPIIPDFLSGDPNVPSANTDWLNEVFQNALSQSHSLTISSGTDRGYTLMSINYLNQDGLMVTNNYNRINFRLNSEHNLTDFLTVGESFSFGRSRTNTYPSDGVYHSTGAMFSEALAQQPLLPVYNADGTYAGPMTAMGDARNPIARLNQTKNNYTTRHLALGNIHANLGLMKNLSFTSNLGLNYSNSDFPRFEPKWQEGTRSIDINRLIASEQIDFSWIWSNVLNYNLDMNDHRIDGIIGTEASRFSREWRTASVTNFATEALDYRYLDAGEGERSNSGSESVYTLLSYFGRVNYAFMDRYLLSATIRHDATSKLGPKDNSGIFPALSLGWRVSREDFMQDIDLISDLKLRLGWGMTGNQEIANYSTFHQWGSAFEYTSYDIGGSNSSAVPGYRRILMGNQDLRWETTTQTNVGFDIALMEGRFYSSADYFYKYTTDMLIQPEISAVVGEGAFPYINGADMENRGFEILIGYRQLLGSGFSYNASLNFDLVRNKVVKVDGVDYFEAGGMSRTLPGYPVSTFFGYINEGLFQNAEDINTHANQAGAALGLIKFKDVNEDGVVDALDRTYMGNPHPNYSFGLNLGAGYKGFDLNMFFNGMQGNSIYTRSVRQRLDFYNNPYGKSTRTLNAWTPENTNTSVPILSVGNPGNVQRHSSYFVEDGSYLKLKSIVLGYEFPVHIANRLSIDNLRFYLQVQEVFTITNYEGTDPELSTSANPLAMGIDNNLYPLPRTFTFGINLSF